MFYTDRKFSLKSRVLLVLGVQVLGVRLTQLTLVRGTSTRHKLLMVEKSAPEQVGANFHQRTFIKRTQTFFEL